jgi:hypothetical protein
MHGYAHRSLSFLALGAALALGPAALSCSSSSGSPRACAAPSDCPAGADCVLGACVAGGLPLARIALVGAAVTHRALVFDGGGSADPNAGHGLVGWTWAIRRAGARCAPTPDRGSAARLSTLFTCEGRYEVDLKVKDDLGLESPTATLAVDVEPALDPPDVTAGADLSAAHRCAGTPLTCTALSADGSDRFQLSAQASDVEDGTALTYAWSWAPPDGIDPASVSVRFSPGPAASAPEVHLESAGTRLAGDWTFTVAATDRDGLTSLATQRVTVTNGDPVVTLLTPSPQVPHQFLPSSPGAQTGTFRAAGTVRATVIDPDGDPLETPALALSEPAPSGCAFASSGALAAGGAQADFALSVDSTGAQGFLMPGRQLTLTVADVNGGRASATAALAVLNSPPVVQWSSRPPGSDDGSIGTIAASHLFDRAIGAYRVQVASPHVASDPEGDPLTFAIATRRSPARTALAGAGMALTVTTPDATELRGGDGLSPIDFRTVAYDPWTSSADTAASHFAVAVQNHPPRLTAAGVSGSVSIDHHWDATSQALVAQVDVAAVVDDDGDPISATAFPAGDCAPALAPGDVVRVTCAHAVPVNGTGAPSLSSFVGSHAVALTPRDAWDAGPAIGSTVTVKNRKPTNPGGNFGGEDCVCGSGPDACGDYYWTLPAGSGASAVLPIADPDGSPMWITVTPLSGTVSSAAAFTSRDGVSIAGGPDFTASVTATDGAEASSATYHVWANCSKIGEVCKHVKPADMSHCQ